MSRVEPGERKAMGPEARKGGWEEESGPWGPYRSWQSLGFFPNDMRSYWRVLNRVAMIEHNFKGLLWLLVENKLKRTRMDAGRHVSTLFSYLHSSVHLYMKDTFPVLHLHIHASITWLSLLKASSSSFQFEVPLSSSFMSQLSTHLRAVRALRNSLSLGEESGVNTLRLPVQGHNK